MATITKPTAQSGTLSAAEYIKANLNEIGKLLQSELRKELQAQGHKATGSLINSIEYTVGIYTGQLALIVEYLEYGQIQNEGVKPNRIPYGNGSGGGQASLYITALQEWVMRKGISTNGSEALGIAFAIAKTHAKEGMPTNGSYRYSTNGRRLGFQDYVLAQQSDAIVAQLSDGLSEGYLAELDTFLSQQITITI